MGALKRWCTRDAASVAVLILAIIIMPIAAGIVLGWAWAIERRIQLWG